MNLLMEGFNNIESFKNFPLILPSNQKLSIQIQPYNLLTFYDLTMCSLLRFEICCNTHLSLTVYIIFFYNL